jgi:hypothetical protein
MHKKIISILIAFVFLVVTSGFALASDISNQDTPATFQNLAMDVARMDKFYSGGNGTPVVFDAKSASKAGFSKKSIILAQEMANFTNDLVKPSPRGGKSLKAADVNMEISISYVENRYPTLAAFYKAASTFANQQISGIDTSNVMPTGYPNPAYATCGWYTSPLPTTGAPYKTYTSPNPAATLKSWGYHQTPDNGAGGGWTRDQTYASWLCGFRTYRDHASLYPSSKTKFWEQNYKGFTPRGEPNPELWRVGPWPYATWPAYNYWWHQTH